MKKAESRVNQDKARLLIERDFLDALDRIVAGKPKNKSFAKLAAEGRLRVTYATVAKEAKRSRTLIGHDGCAYPRVRERVSLAMRGYETTIPRSTGDVVARLRDEIATLRTQLSAAVHSQAEHFHAREKAERAARAAQAAHQRVLRHQNDAQKLRALPSADQRR